MQIFQRFLPWPLMLALLTIAFHSCDNEDPVVPGDEGTVRFEITDGPIDDPNVQAVFVTVANVKVDGEVIDGFAGKQTIDLLLYQNGKVKALGTDQLEAGTYGNVELVLDLTQDATNTGPGSYVLTRDGVKHQLSINGNTSGEVSIGSSEFVVEDGETTDVVIDFDLRKAIRYQSGTGNDRYDFVANADLSNALRLVAKTETGAITGTATRGAALADATVVAYAYVKGTYNASERQAQGDAQIRFRNAVTSARVDAMGKYQLSFLQEGDYEVVLAAYEDEDGDGEVEFQGTVQVDILGGILDLADIQVNANAMTAVNLSLIGLLP